MCSIAATSSHSDLSLAQTMVPHPHSSINGSLITHTFSTIKSSPLPYSSETITTIVFGLCALSLGVITIWQSRKAWRIWHANYERSSYAQGTTGTPFAPFNAYSPDDRVAIDLDIELGNPTSAPTTTPGQDQPSLSFCPSLPSPSQVAETLAERNLPPASSNEVDAASSSLEQVPFETHHSQETLEAEPALTAHPHSITLEATEPASMPLQHSGA